MKYKTHIQRIWTAAAILALGLTAYHWFTESESAMLLNAIVVLDAVLFAIALPASVFAVAVAVAASMVLEMSPLNADGAYLNTIVLSILGTMQWFWLTRFYFPPETPFQKLEIAT